MQLRYIYFSKEEDISIVQASIEYDADILEYRFGGNAVELIKAAGYSRQLTSRYADNKVEIRFTAIKPGKAKVAVNQSQLIGLIQAQCWNQLQAPWLPYQTCSTAW